MQDQVVTALGALFERVRRRGGAPLADHDPAFPSPAELLPAHAGKVAWQPWRRPEPAGFDNVATALAMPVHAALPAFFGHYFAGNLPVCFKGLFLTLLQPWNQEDFERLQQNQIGHQLMLRKLGLPASWFLASCRDEQRLVTLDNASGEVLLERLGKGPIGVLAPDLATFLQRLEPC
ncbi:SecY-interacting protein Syd [Zobellella iuensis]|uniref:SecY-interacting protein Syd n=1 Tax=Zobellella iuensis TaxID=2803811 RepID=A0ABS1QTW8_9GAMM|nr:SecY-interacting protein Syd [Zobellella iuensis]MBL1378315.1 SecY-interacting protein Syd [Zobellella iuensis]